jgi:hypothetical protein
MAVISYHALRAPGEASRTVLASCTLELSNCSLICRHLSPMRQSGPATKLGSIFLHNQCVNGGERPCSVLARFGSSNGAGKLRNFGHGTPLGVCSQAGRRHHRRKGEIAGRSWNRNSFASKDRGDDKVEINIDLEEIKQKAGDAVAAAKNALQTSFHHAEQVSMLSFVSGFQCVSHKDWNLGVMQFIIW